MEPQFDYIQGITRRHFLGTCNAGIGAMALNMLLGRGDSVQAAVEDTVPHWTDARRW